MAGRSKAVRYPLIEWVSAAIGLAITAGMFGFLALEAVSDGEGVPPVLEAEPAALFFANGRYIVEVDVENLSSQTASAVNVEGALMAGNEPVETSSATLAYVPGDSKRRSGLFFARDPRELRLRLRVTGYERP